MVLIEIRDTKKGIKIENHDFMATKDETVTNNLLCNIINSKKFRRDLEKNLKEGKKYGY